MPQYRYEVKKAPGEKASGVLEAETQRAAVARLRDMGYFPIKVEEFAGDISRESVRRRFTRIGLKDRNIFFRQLANLFESGMTLTRSLGTLAEQNPNPKFVAVIEQIRDDVQKGTTFTEALEQHPKLFSPMQCSMIHAGESGGMLDEVLWQIVDFGEQEEQLRGKAISALIYPVFLMIMGTAAVFILVSFVFPKFIVVFEDFSATLPWPTVIVMSVCGFMGKFWWAVIIVVAILISMLVRYWRTTEGRLHIDTLILKVPVLGGVTQKYVMAQFARTLGTLLDNGVPVLQAMRITVTVLSNKCVAGEVAAVQERVAQGESISAGLRDAPHFPPIVVNMFAVGEESGRLGAVTKRMADAFDIEVDRAVQAMTALFEPILIVIMGVIIGFLVIAMLLPMLTLSSNVV